MIQSVAVQPHNRFPLPFTKPTWFNLRLALEKVFVSTIVIDLVLVPTATLHLSTAKQNSFNHANETQWALNKLSKMCGHKFIYLIMQWHVWVLT